MIVHSFTNALPVNEPRLMKLSTRARYGLRCMIAVSKMGREDQPVPIARVAQSTHISKRYLEQLAITLKNASLLRSVSGRGGGYHLARPAEEIKIGEIVESAIGAINIVDCVLCPEQCEKADYCNCRGLYAKINRRITDMFYEYTLAELSDDEWQHGPGSTLMEPDRDSPK